MRSPISTLLSKLAFVFPLVLVTACSYRPYARIGAPATPSAPGTCAPGPFNAALVEKQAGPATVLIATNNGVGSGFVISDGGGQLVVSNYHVVASGTEHVAVQTAADGGQRRVSLEVVRVSRERDLALLRPASGLGQMSLTLSAKSPDIGTSVAVVGYPGVVGSNFTLTFEPGTVTATQRHLETHDFIQTNANINPGNSGGPLVDGCGQVVGVVAARHSTTERVGLVIPAGAVNELLAEYHQPQLTPQAAAEAQLQRLSTEVKFRRSDKVARYFTRHFVDKSMIDEVNRLIARVNAKIEALKASKRTKARDPSKRSQAELEKEVTPQLSPDEREALELGNAVQAKKLSGFDAGQRWLASHGADLFGDVEDIWIESTSTTKEGCVDAYVTATGGGQTRRYVAHLHHENGEWLVDFVNKMR